MHNNHEQVKLTAAELSLLWTNYLADSMSVCVFKYFLKHIEDKPIQNLLNKSLEISQNHLEIITEIFKREQIAIPHGFTDNDVNLNAKRLFSDVFYLRYLNHMVQGGLATFSRSLQNVIREDMRGFYSKGLSSTIELYNESTRLLLEKGLAVRPPTIPYPQQVNFIQKQSFLLEGLGRREALTGTEITQLHFNIQTNHLGACLATAFGQVAKSDQVRKYFLRGKDIAIKHVKVFADYLENNSLPVPMSYMQEVKDSTEAPFSDKLMMFHFAQMIYSGIGNYGIAISNSQKSDLVIDFSRLVVEVLKYSEDGINIMIANEWLEQPPLAANRKELAK